MKERRTIEEVGILTTMDDNRIFEYRIFVNGISPSEPSEVEDSRNHGCLEVAGALGWTFDEPEVEEYDYILNKDDPNVMYGLYIAIQSGAVYDSTTEIVTILNPSGQAIKYKLLSLG